MALPAYSPSKVYLAIDAVRCSKFYSRSPQKNYQSSPPEMASNTANLLQCRNIWNEQQASTPTLLTCGTTMTRLELTLRNSPNEQICEAGMRNSTDEQIREAWMRNSPDDKSMRQ